MFRNTAAALTVVVALAAPAVAQDPTTAVTAIYSTFAERLNADDVDGILALFAEDAVFVPAPGQAVTGADIAGAMGQFAQLSDSFTATVRSVFEAGDNALAIVDWELKGKNADGSDLTLTGTTSDVLERSADGTWQFIVDNPFGTASAN